MEVIGITALACGLICVGTCNEDVTTTILQVLMEKAESSDLKVCIELTNLRFFPPNIMYYLISFFFKIEKRPKEKKSSLIDKLVKEMMVKSGLEIFILKLNKLLQR